MDDFVIEKISRGMLIVSLNGHEISFEGEMFFPNNEFHFSLYAKTAKQMCIRDRYMEAFMVSENLKEKILEMFSLPFLYTLKEQKEQNDYEIIGFDKL